MINGKQAVEIYFAHNEYFANGSVQASIREGNFKTGLDEDLKNKIKALDIEPLTSKMRSRLLNESLEYVDSNTRQIELYNLMLEEINSLQALLATKCQESKK